MKAVYFFTACLSAVVVLVPLGAPIGAMAAGIMVAALFGLTMAKPKKKRRLQN
jgi:multisubunit Na+/H+ antiporter MnhB subunit